MLLSLSWKNIWRNKTRSLVIIFAIVLGVIGGVGLSAFVNGLFLKRVNMAIENEASNIQIHNSQFLLNKEIIDTIPDCLKITTVLDTFKKVKAYSLRIKCVSMINSANSGDGIMLNGINPEKEKLVTGIYKFIIKGNYFSEKRKNGILLGDKLVQKLKIKLRSKVVLTFQTTTGEITSAAFKVIGIYKTSNSGFDEHNAYVNSMEIIPIIGCNPNNAHEIAISVFEDDFTENVIGTLKNIFNNDQIEIQSWKEVMPELNLLNGATEYMLYIFMTIIFLALSFGIINTMLMAVLERIREIGMLMAIGMNKPRIFKMIMLETILLMSTGSAVGLVFAYLIVNFFKVHGIDLSVLGAGLSDLGFSSIIHPFLKPSAYVAIVILVITTGILSSIVPARKALSLNPSEAIRKL